MNRATLEFALKISRKYEADFAASLARLDFCEHGTCTGYDWDNICGSCEMGYTMSDPMQRYSAALAEAKKRMEKMTALSNHAIELRMLGVENVDSIIDEISRLRDL